MKIRVLGCHGGQSPIHRTTCFQFDDDKVLDAGALATTLYVDEQVRIEHVLLSQAQLDHVHDLALFADNVIPFRRTPIVVHCSQTTRQVLETHYFNNVMWPDFTQIPLPQKPDEPALKMQTFEPMNEFALGRFRITPIPTNHPVDSMGFVLRDRDGAVVISGDTGPTDLLWEMVAQVPNLKAVFCEVSYPNALEQLAQVSGHLTPATMLREISKVGQDGFPVLVYHLKPPFEEEVRAELRALRDRRVTILRTRDEFQF